MAKKEPKPSAGKAPPSKKKRSRFKAALRVLFLLAFAGFVAAAATAAGLYLYFSKDLPQIATLSDYQPPVVTTVYSDDGRKIAEFFREMRYVIELDQMPEPLVQAFVAAEDSRFFEHQGLDFLGILRAAVKNIEAGGIVQGGSTITQQVTKSFLLTPEKSFRRKIKEAILAYRIERAFTKKQILFLYLNQIYLGQGTYGVEAASRRYFGKPAREMNLAEAAMLAGLPQAPSKYSPVSHPKKARQRQIYVLNRMVEEGYISNIQATEAINTPVDIQPKRNLYIEEIPYYTEQVRRYVEDKYGREALYGGGLNIYTAANVEMQKEARVAIAKGLLDLDRRQGYRGPEKKLSPVELETVSQEIEKEILETPLAPGRVTRAVVVEVKDDESKAVLRMGPETGFLELSDMRWARAPDPEIEYTRDRLKKVSDALAPGDLIRVRVQEKNREGSFKALLEQDPLAQAALMCQEANTGQVKAMIGGADFSKSQFNRAIQARRQPGSAFKPIIYAAALDKGYTAASVLIDSPIVFQDAEMDFKWKPRNYKETFFGPTLLRDALAHSRNVVTIKILQDIGVNYVIDYARNLGITAPLARDLSIALGSSGVPLSEIVSAYSVFANQGFLIEPCYVTKITDRNGKVLEECSSQGRKVIDKSTAYIMTRLLQGVVEDGTGWRARALKRPVAGKTGTTNDLNDAWFVGYTPRYVTGVWVGFDSDAPLGAKETGSRAASPIWVDFMQEVLKDKPEKAFAVPEGVVFAKIDAKTGLLAIPESRKTIFESFKEGTVPTKYTEKPGITTEPAELLKRNL